MYWYFFLDILSAQSLSKFMPYSSQIQNINPDTIYKRVSEDITKLIHQKNESRLFAVVQICGKQFKVTPGDIVVVEGNWAPNTGDKIKLEKVLVVGGESFSLIGKPLVNSKLVNIEATIIEKTLSHTRTHFKKKRRKQYMRINFMRSQNTMIMINSIDLVEKL